MTNGNPRPDEEPTPPASTRWSDEPSEGDDELAPPFVPGAGPAHATEPAVEPVAEPAVEPESDAAERAPEPAEEDAFPFDPGWDQDEAADADVGEADDFPFEAFDIEGEEAGEPEGDAEAAEPVVAEEPVTHAGPDASPAHELADRLEAMARQIRERGGRAVEAQMADPDRFTALLAGLLAGYLAGRE